MPGYSPATTYPLANYAFIVISQVYITTTGGKFSYKVRIGVSLTIVTIIMVLVPFLAQLRLPLNYWIIFVLLLPYGAFSGVAQGNFYCMIACLPEEYTGANMVG